MKCKRCGNELTEDKERGCMECLVCYPKNRVVPVQEKEKKTYLDVIPNEVRVAEMLAEQVKVDEKRIREIVVDELENWHIQKPPVTRDDYNALIDPPLREEFNQSRNLTASEAVKNANVQAFKQLATITATSATTPTPPDMTWRQEAKALGIRLSQPTGGARKKVDVLADIKARTPLTDKIPAVTATNELAAVSNVAVGTYD